MTDQVRIPTNLRTLLVLEILGLSDRAMTPTEINAQIDLPKQTVHRLVATLLAEGFLIREENSNRYRPSRRSRLLGAGLLHASHVHIARHQILQQVADQVKETVNFVVPQETGMHYQDRIETDWPFRIQMPRGTNVSFHCTASGKVYMASMPKNARKKFVNSLHLTKLTENTHINAETLLDDLSQCAKRGYALDCEEFMEGMVASAVPITDNQGRFVAALAVHGPIQRLSVKQAIANKDILLAAAKRMQAAITS